MLHEALAYIIVKGDDEWLPPLVTATAEADTPTSELLLSLVCL